MSFFDSEVVREEMHRISQLQEEIYNDIFGFSSMSREDKMRHVDKLEELLEKQRILYTRLSLSDDEQASIMKEKIIESASMIGMPTDMDMSMVFSNMGEMLKKIRQKIDETGSDL